MNLTMGVRVMGTCVATVIISGKCNAIIILLLLTTINNNFYTVATVSSGGQGNTVATVLSSTPSRRCGF